MYRPRASLVLLGALSLLAEASVCEDEACSSSPQHVSGVSMLQMKRQDPSAPNPQCPLPAGAKWCQVQLQGLEPYWMAAYDTTAKQDFVSMKVCAEGHWENDAMADFGTPGHMLDIGGNIGYFSFAFAQAGWTVTTFEPMVPNLAMINATLCQNPALAAKIRVNAMGLGEKSQICKMFADQANQGNGHTMCDDALAQSSTVHLLPQNQLVELGQFPIRRLDEILAEQSVAKVDLIKIDVEGDQFRVFTGAPNLLAQYHPRLIKSEVWWQMIGPTGVNVPGVDYLDMFEKQGYKFYTDVKCKVPIDAKTEVVAKGGIESLIICKP
jgi:FkbM family methyltransferase